MVRSSKLYAYLNEYLDQNSFQDSSQNGLQVEGSKKIEKIAFAVDARLETIQKAAKSGAQLLITHHGIFWGHSQLLRGIHFKRVKELIANDLALFAAHLPLDAHMEVGNNVVLAQELGLEKIKPWAKYKGQTIGVQGRLVKAEPLAQFTTRLQEILKPFGGEVKCFGKGKPNVRKIGIVTGDACSEVRRAARDKLDVFITGEPDHVMAMDAQELGIHFVTGGHYATEVFGVRALAKHIELKFNVETIFINAPTYA